SGAGSLAYSSTAAAVGGCSTMFELQPKAATKPMTATLVKMFLRIADLVDQAFEVLGLELPDVRHAGGTDLLRRRQRVERLFGAVQRQVQPVEADLCVVFLHRR